MGFYRLRALARISARKRGSRLSCLSPAAGIIRLRAGSQVENLGRCFCRALWRSVPLSATHKGQCSRWSAAYTTQRPVSRHVRLGNHSIGGTSLPAPLVYPGNRGHRPGRTTPADFAKRTADLYARSASSLARRRTHARTTAADAPAGNCRVPSGPAMSTRLRYAILSAGLNQYCAVCTF